MAAYNKWGSSVIYIHTSKGKSLMELSDSDFKQFQTDARPALKSSFALKNAVKKRLNRSMFSRTFVRYGLVAACNLKSVYWLDQSVSIKGRILRQMVHIRNIMFHKFIRR